MFDERAKFITTAYSWNVAIFFFYYRKCTFLVARNVFTHFSINASFKKLAENADKNIKKL